MSDRCKCFLAALSAALLPLAFTIIWLIHNTELPCNDAANYLRTSSDIYHFFSDKGFFHGVYHAYIERGWRPILFPVFAVPFLILSHGSLFFSYAAVAVLCILASAIYAYLFLRLKLDRGSAVIGANLIGILPLVQAQALLFFAEAAFLPCIIGCVYHLIKSDYLRNNTQSWLFAILLALALMIRPVEAVTHLIFVLVVFIFAGWRQGIFKSRDIMGLLAICFFASLLFFSKCMIHYSHLHSVQVTDLVDHKMREAAYIAFFGNIVAIVLLMCAARFKGINLFKQRLILPFRNDNYGSLLVPAFATVLLLVLIWYLPFASQTFEWVYRTSLGDVAANTNEVRLPFFITLYNFACSEGALAVGVIALLAVIGFFSISNQQRRELIFSKAFIYPILVLPITFFEVLFTVQTSARKLSVALPFLLISFLILGLQAGRTWLIRFSMLTLLLVLQFSMLIIFYFGHYYDYANPIVINVLGDSIHRPVTIKPNPHDVVLDFLGTQAEKYDLHNIAIEVIPGPSPDPNVITYVVNPFLLSTMIADKRVKFDANYPYYSDFSQQNIESLVTRYDGIFLADNADRMLVSDESAEKYSAMYASANEASLKIMDAMLMYYSKNQLGSIGWKLGPCIDIKLQDQVQARGCLLLPANK